MCEANVLSREFFLSSQRWCCTPAAFIQFISNLHTWLWVIYAVFVRAFYPAHRQRKYGEYAHGACESTEKVILISKVHLFIKVHIFINLFIPAFIYVPVYLFIYCIYTCPSYMVRCSPHDPAGIKRCTQTTTSFCQIKHRRNMTWSKQNMWLSYR